MKPIYLDTHIHTSSNPNRVNTEYDLDLLIENIKTFNGDSDFLISLTDHNMINKSAYLNAVEKGINILLGVELHIRNYDNCPAYHCHIYFNIKELDEVIIDDINKSLDILYPNKEVEKLSPDIPTIQDIINQFDTYEFMLLPHGGQSHAMFNDSIPSDTKFDTTLERSIYYNQFDGFTARGDARLEKTQGYFKKLGINEFVNLVTCSDNYTPSSYPKGKDKNPFKPTWMFANPTYNGLRLSLSEQSRLIYSDTKPSLWSQHIKSVNLEKENISIDIEFTSGLNVIIGSSSSGKSLLADSIYRKIGNHEMNEAYKRYEVDKLLIDNPSRMVPHYLSQNYIMSIVNNVSDDKIENIEIIKNVFPGDQEVKERINSELRSFKKNIQQLVKHVKVIETESSALDKIPVFTNLITSGTLEHNIFEKIVPTKKEEQDLSYSIIRHEQNINFLDELDNQLTKYPFVNHDRELITKLKEELESVLESNNIEKQIREIITAEKDEYNRELRQRNTEDQTKKQSFDKLLASLKEYSKSYACFFSVLNKISNYSIDFESEEIESMGHKLFIGNNFTLNKDKFLEVVNQFLKTPIQRFDDIEPSNFFFSNFKQRPKVHDYDDFELKIYGKFEELNRKNYKITTKDGREFEKLSPGWKTSVILDIILGYENDIAPIIIDQPEDNLATNYINKGLVTAIKTIKEKKQVILVSHNATIPMLADAQNVVLCQNIDNKLIIRSDALEGEIDGKSVVDHIAEITDGGKPSIKKRVKKYNLKKFNQE